MADSIAKLAVVITGDVTPLSLAMDRARADLLKMEQTGSSSMLKLNQATGVAGRAFSALRTGSILPLIGALGSSGLAGAIIASGAGIAALAKKVIEIADAAKQAKEEFFAKVDALKKLGADTSFADHVERVKSLKTAWGEAREAAEQYVTTLVGRLERGGAGGGAALGATNMSATGDAVAAGLRMANNLTETMEQRMDRLRDLIAQGRLAGEQDRFKRMPGLREQAEREAERRKVAMAKEFNELMANMAEAEKQAHDEKMRMLKEHAAEVGKVADRMRALVEETRTPAERLAEKLREIQDLLARGLDPDTGLRALRALEESALGLVGGTPQRQSQAAIRAGSVEALRAQFGGGVKDERAKDATIKAEKHAAESKTVLIEIRDAIKSTSIGVME